MLLEANHLRLPFTEDTEGGEPDWDRIEEQEAAQELAMRDPGLPPWKPYEPLAR